jgi:hypothetical protein
MGKRYMLYARATKMGDWLAMSGIRSILELRLLSITAFAHKIDFLAYF